MYISDFNYHKPSSIQEACVILAESPDGAPLAGGTDLLVEMKQGLRHHQDIVSLTAINELKAIEQDEANLYIGAGVTHNEMLASPLIKEIFPAIAETASVIGTDQVRNTGTIGGNLCTGASCSDMAPILMALDASAEIRSAAETRIVPFREFFVFHKETHLKKGEIIVRVIVPKAKTGTGSWFEKFGLREAASISVASAAVVISVEDGVCDDVCVIIGAVAPTSKISTGANDALIGKRVSELSEGSSLLKQAGEAAAEDALPLDDIRGTADYRRHLTSVLVQRAVVKALARANSCRPSIHRTKLT